MNSQQIILLSSVGNLDKAFRLANNEDAIVICLDEIALQMAKNKNAKHFYSVANYLDLSEAELRKWADECSLQWFKIDGKDYSMFDDISTGELFTVEVAYKALFELEKIIVFVQKIIQLHKPSAWFLATNDNKLFSQIIQTHFEKPIHITQIYPVFKTWARRNLNFLELKLWLRQEGWDYYFRTAIFQFISIWKKREITVQPDLLKSKVIFLLDIPTASVIDTLVPVIQEIPSRERLIIASDPRCYQLLKQYNLEGTPFSPEAFSLLSYPKTRVTKKEIFQRWEALAHEREKHPLSMTFRGVDIWNLRKTYFRKQFLRKTPLALAHYQLALAVIKTSNVRAVVSAADNHYMSQLFVRAAKKNNRYALAIQHGMVNHPEGYLPIRASQLAVMGEAVRDWLVKNGGLPHQIVVTGQPRFDALIKPPTISREKLLEELEFSPSLPIWLIAPEPQLGIWMRDLIFNAIALVKDVQAIIRVHPNDNPLDYQLSLEAHHELHARVRISRHHDIKSAINCCDVVLLGRSTIGLEALILGKNLIVIHPEATTGWIMPPYIQEYLQNVPFLGVSTPEALAETWKFLQNPTHPSLNSLRQKIVHHYACNNDGKNAWRVAQLLSTISSH